MAIKYISKNKEGVWKVSVTKTGKAIKTFETQKEAIAYAGTIKNTESILIKRETGWQLATGWDLNVAREAEQVVKNSKAQGKSTSQAKAKAVAKATDTQLEIKKVDISPVTKPIEKTSITKTARHHLKKHKKSYLGWALFYFFLIAIVAAAILIYWFMFK